MIGIIIATHGKMSDGILDAVKLIMGTTENMEALNLMPGQDVQELKQNTLDKIAAVDQGNGVIIFTDLFGASPYNQATMAVHSMPAEQKEKVFVITGVNLPMIMEAMNQSMLNAPIAEAVESVLREAKQSMLIWPDQSAADEADEEDEEDDF